MQTNRVDGGGQCHAFQRVSGSEAPQWQPGRPPPPCARGRDFQGVWPA